MPIYDLQINAETRKGDHAPVQYHGSGDPLTTRVIHFGTGDVMIETGRHIDSPIDEAHSDLLMFRQSSEPHPIGIEIPDGVDDPTGNVVVPPVKLYFEKAESIDVVIHQLEKLKTEFKENMPSTQTAEERPTTD